MIWVVELLLFIITNDSKKFMILCIDNSSISRVKTVMTSSYVQLTKLRKDRVDKIIV